MGSCREYMYFGAAWDFHGCRKYRLDSTMSMSKCL